MPKFNVTYSITTPESAEHGDYAECGFLSADGDKVDNESFECGPAAAKVKAECAMSLRQALALCSPNEDSGSWFSECDGRDDYRTGENETRSLHPPENITAASYGRLARLLGL